MSDAVATPRAQGWYWPWLVVLALGGTVGANVILVVAASGDANGAVVEADYYRKAVAWEGAMERRRESLALGWQVRARLERADATAGVDAGARLLLEVSDRDRRPLAGARFTAVLIHNLDAARPVAAALSESAPGRYEAAVAVTRPGLWEVRVEGARGTERFSESLRVDAFTRSPAADR